MNFLDSPSGDPLKIHNSPIPALGGMAILFAILCSSLFSAFLFRSLAKSLFVFTIAVSIVTFIGLVDDRRGVPPWKRVAGHIVAGSILILLNHYFIDIFSNRIVDFGITLFYLVGCINALNLIDGIDGLATGIALIASLSFFLAFAVSANVLGAILSLMVMGTSAGFLFYNFNPAKIFLGDNGSTALGFLLGILAVLYSLKPYSVGHVLFPIFVLLVPIFETSFAIVRRIKRGVPITQGDRDHFYDYLISRGLSQKKTTLIMYLWGVVGAFLGFAIINSH